jgi:hypothetical protein
VAVGVSPHCQAMVVIECPTVAKLRGIVRGGGGGTTVGGRQGQSRGGGGGGSCVLGLTRCIHQCHSCS